MRACVLGVFVSRSAVISDFLMKDATPSRRRFQMSWPTFSTLRPGCKLKTHPLRFLLLLLALPRLFTCRIVSQKCRRHRHLWRGGGVRDNRALVSAPLPSVKLKQWPCAVHAAKSSRGGRKGGFFRRGNFAPLVAFGYNGEVGTGSDTWFFHCKL